MGTGPNDQSDGFTPVRVLDLFAGAGGLSRGFHQSSTGYRTVRAVEFDLPAAATYVANHGDVVFAGGIHDWLEAEDVPDVDVVIGGPPCQGFSALGRQDVHDERNTLWQEYAESVRRSSPSYFVLENVGPFERSEQYQHFVEATSPGGVLADYTFQSDILNAADYGAAQTRRRCIVIGHHRDLPFPGWPPTTVVRSEWSTVRDVLGSVASSVGAVDLPDRSIVFRDRVLPGPFRSDELHLGRDYTPLSLSRFEHIPAGGNRFDLPHALKAPCWRKHDSGSGDVMGRLVWDKPSVTIRTEFFKPEKGRYIHPTEHRAITHYEAALLQGFPTDYKWVGSKVSIARQIGNAVPIPLGEAIGAHIMAQLRPEADALVDRLLSTPSMAS